MEEELFAYLSQYIELTPEESAELIRHQLFRQYPKGHILLKEGEISNESFFVLTGCIRSYCIIDGEEKTTAFFTEHQGLTPSSTTTQKPSTHYLECIEECLLSISTPDMEESFFEKFPRFERFCRIMAEKQIADQQLSIETYMNLTPEQRYLHLQKTRPDLLHRVPQYQLASFVGVKPESLSRIRRRMFDREHSN